LQKTANNEIAEHITACLQLAILLEINAPKPGNVHRNANFHKTHYEHFLASTVAIASSLKTATTKGIQVAEGKIRTADIGIGEIIKDAVQRIDSWQHGGNTLLGTIILLIPMAAAAGKTMKENNGTIDLTKLRTNMKAIVTATTPEDAVAVYEAIAIAKPGGLNKAPRFDATQTSSKQEILETRTALFDVFKISAEYDAISSEWVNDFTIIFDVGYPFLQEELKKRNNINDAVVHTFLKVLSEASDTLIARRIGLTKAQEISHQAKETLELGGIDTKKGKEALEAFDKNLRDPENKLNPGTTADLITATLALLILNGYRP
jgi:triphosphoribosyl-dephospho-CoA synthase